MERVVDDLIQWLRSNTPRVFILTGDVRKHPCCHLESCESFRCERFLGEEFEGVRITELQASNSTSQLSLVDDCLERSLCRSSVASIKGPG